MSWIIWPSRAAREQRRLLEAGVLVLADQLDAVGEREDLAGRGWCRGRRGAAWRSSSRSAQPRSASCSEAASSTSASSAASDFEHELGAQHLAHAGLLRLDGLVQLVEREVLRPRARAARRGRRRARRGRRR